MIPSSLLLFGETKICYTIIRKEDKEKRMQNHSFLFTSDIKSMNAGRKPQKNSLKSNIRSKITLFLVYKPEKYQYIYTR
jgi:hypothetical protein